MEEPVGERAPARGPRRRAADVSEQSVQHPGRALPKDG